jgi:hypothetical protein
MTLLLSAWTAAAAPPPAPPRCRYGGGALEEAYEAKKGDLRASSISRAPSAASPGDIVQYVAVPSGPLSTDAILVLHVCERTSRVEVVKRLRDPENAVLERVP